MDRPPAPAALPALTGKEAELSVKGVARRGRPHPCCGGGGSLLPGVPCLVEETAEHRLGPVTLGRVSEMELLTTRMARQMVLMFILGSERGEPAWRAGGRGGSPPSRPSLPAPFHRQPGSG